MPSNNLFSLKLSCPNCRQAGFVAWEGRSGALPRIAFLSRGFHPQSPRTSTGHFIIVCDVCDEIQEGITHGAMH